MVKKIIIDNNNDFSLTNQTHLSIKTLGYLNYLYPAHLGGENKLRPVFWEQTVPFLVAPTLANLFVSTTRFSYLYYYYCLLIYGSVCITRDRR